MRSMASILMMIVFAAIGVSTVEAAPGDEAAQSPWEGEVSGMNVYVRSGPGSNYYPTTKLNRGDHVLVVGEKFGWWRITPPPESFSFVDKASVRRQPGSSTGDITRDKTYVRAGSHLSGRKTSTQVVLSRGATVEIIGEAEGFYKIAPPRGAGLYMSREYVKPVPQRLRTGMLERYLAADAPAQAMTESKETGSSDSAAASPQSERPSSSAGAQMEEVAEGGAEADAKDEDGPPLTAESALPALAGLSARGGDRGEAGVPVESPAQRPAKTGPRLTGRYHTLLTVLETEMQAMLRNSPAKQDLRSLLPRYGEIAGQQEAMVPSEIAKLRIHQLNELISFRAAQAEIHTDIEELERFRAQMDSERMEIMRRRAEAPLNRFDLKGELRRSYAFAPEKRRFRLIDPDSQTTIAYVDVPRTIGVDVHRMIGRIVGIQTAGQRFSTSARVPIAVASSITDLTTRGPVSGVTPAEEGSDPANKRAEIAKSTGEADRHGPGAASERRPVVTAGEDGED